MENKYPDFSKRLFTLMAEQKKTTSDLKDEINITYEMARRYIMGAAFPRPDKLEAIAEWLNSSVSFLAYGISPSDTANLISTPNASRAPYQVEMANGDDDSIAIPYYDVKGSCGGGSENGTPEVKGLLRKEPEWFEKYKIKPQNAICIYAHGDSMEPYLIHGDMVILDNSQTEAQSGGVYLINHPDGERLKRLRREFDGTWVLESDNINKKMYPDERISPEHADLMRIIGRVIYRQG